MRVTSQFLLGAKMKKKFFADMPQKEVMTEWPKAPYGSPENLTWGIATVDHQMKADLKGKKKGKYPKMY